MLPSLLNFSHIRPVMRSLTVPSPWSIHRFARLVVVVDVPGTDDVEVEDGDTMDVVVEAKIVVVVLMVAWLPTSRGLSDTMPSWTSLAVHASRTLTAVFSEWSDFGRAQRTAASAGSTLIRTSRSAFMGVFSFANEFIFESSLAAPYSSLAAVARHGAGRQCRLPDARCEPVDAAVVTGSSQTVVADGVSGADGIVARAAGA